jgi:hypothetical protein
MVEKAKTREERLFSAAVLRRSFPRRGAEHAEGVRVVDAGVLRDMGIEDEDVVRFLDANLEAVDKAIGRKG